MGLQKKRTNLRISSETSGLMAVITVECDHAQMLCELRNALGAAVPLQGRGSLDAQGHQRIRTAEQHDDQP
jgi:hypothetical protein